MPNRLLLEIESEPYEVTCIPKACCECDAWGSQCTNDSRHGYDTKKCKKYRTGKRRVRVTGMVEVEVKAIDTMEGAELLYGQKDLEIAGTCKSIICHVVRRYRTDTLPASVRDGLTQEDCE